MNYFSPARRRGRRKLASALAGAALAAASAAGAQSPAAPPSPPPAAPTTGSQPAPAIPSAPDPSTPVPPQPGPAGVAPALGGDRNGETRDLTMDEAVQLALRLNPTLEQADAAIRRAEGVVAEARSFERPRLDANGNVTLQTPIPTFSLTLPSTTPGQPPVTQTIVLEHHLQRSLEVTGRYNPDPFGRLRANTRNYRDQLKAEHSAYYVAQNELVYAVQNVYVAALRAIALTAVSQESIADAQEQLRYAEARNRAGTAPDYDVLSAQVRVRNLQQNLLAAQSLATRTVTNLSRLLAIDPTVKLRLAPITLPEAPDDAALATAKRVLEPQPEAGTGAVPESVETALSEAYEQRPEIYRAEWTRRAAEARVRFERKGSLPTVVTDAGYLLTPDVGGFVRQKQTWSLVANIAAPIWDAGLTRARTKQARADVSAATAQLTEARDLVAEEVKNFLTNFEEASERRRSTAANVTQAREALRIANVRYQAGLTANVEVIDAQLALTNSLLNEVNADHDFIAALADLNRSLGRYATAALAELRSEERNRGEGQAGEGAGKAGAAPGPPEGAREGK